MKHSTILVLAGILILSAFFAGCTQQAAAPAQALKIGVVASMTGPSSSTGKGMWQSSQLAADEINANGGVYLSSLGKKVPIQLVLGDDASTREGGMTAVTKLITQDNVDMLVGWFYS